MNLYTYLLIGGFVSGLIFCLFKNRKLSIFTNILSTTVIFVIFPLFIFSTILQQNRMVDFLSMIFCAIFVVVGMLPACYIFKRYWKLEKDSFLPILFMNSGYFGIPLCYNFYLDEGLHLAVVYNLTIGILILSLGVALVGSKPIEFLKYPSIYAVLLALIIKYTNVSVDFPNLSWLIKFCGPMMMFIVGYWLKEGFTKKFLKEAFFAALLRTFGGLVLGCIYIYLFNISSHVEKGVILLLSSSSSALLGFVIAKKYYKEAHFSATTLVISTAIYICSLPLILFFIEKIT